MQVDLCYCGSRPAWDNREISCQNPQCGHVVECKTKAQTITKWNEGTKYMIELQNQNNEGREE